MESESADDAEGSGAGEGLAGWEKVFDDSDLAAGDFESYPYAEAARAERARKAEAKLQWIVSHTHSLCGLY